MPRTGRVPLATAASLFLSDRQAQRMEAGTLRFYTDKVGHFVRWCDAQGVTHLDDVTPNLVRLYFTALIERAYAPNTQNMLGRAVRAFLRWCAAEGLVRGNPMGNVRIPAPPREVLPALKPRDVQALLDAAADARARAMILILLDTGVRAREFLDLNGGDVDMNAATVRVRRGKTGKNRTTFISPPTVKALLAYYREQGWPEDDEAIWRNQRTGERLTDSGVRQVLNDTAKAAGMKTARPHQFRRTFALWSLRQGVDVHTLAKLMGHEDITVLKRYLDLDESDTLQAHRKADIVRRFLK